MTDHPTRPAIPAGLAAGGVVAIARHIGAAKVVTIADALADGGVRALELTLNDPEADALRAIESAAIVAPRLGLEIGAGTVLTIESASRAIDAGATFLVMPHLDTAIVTWAAERGIPAFPGCATPTEVLAGWAAGAAAIKVFPASSLGPSFVRELRGPFPAIPLVPTGGVTLETIPAFVAPGQSRSGSAAGSWAMERRQASASVPRRPWPPSRPRERSNPGSTLLNRGDTSAGPRPSPPWPQMSVMSRATAETSRNAFVRHPRADHPPRTTSPDTGVRPS